jgi:hypothetical protein
VRRHRRGETPVDVVSRRFRRYFSHWDSDQSVSSQSYIQDRPWSNSRKSVLF